MFFIFIADLMAKSFYWYSLVWYFDMMMHFLGGLWLGWFFIYVFLPEEVVLSCRTIIKVLMMALLVGILWEFFEYFMNVISNTHFDIGDTVSDVILDLAGAAVSIFYFIKLIMPQNKV